MNENSTAKSTALPRKKILLIEPPFYRLFKNTYSLNKYPLSLGYLAGTIKKETDWDVLVYNADFTRFSESTKTAYMGGKGFRNYLENLKDLSKPAWKKIASAVEEYKPDAVGISAKTQNFTSACNAAKIVKRVDSNITVIMGGPHPSIAGPRILECPDIDICARGEGEKTIVELLDAIKEGKTLFGINGIVYREAGKARENPPRELIRDLDSLCFPNEYAQAVLKDYALYPKTAFKNIFALRGCPYNCLFCGSRQIWGRKVRFRSPENVTEEINRIMKTGVSSVHFDDDSFGVDKKYIRELCDRLRLHCPGLRWSCELHVKIVDEDTIARMKDAGCYSISVGVESGNNEILKTIRKGITIEEALRACEMITKQGIRVSAFYMIGSPHETEETLRDTYLAIKKTSCTEVIFSIFTPYPHTESFELCRQLGIVNDDFDVALYNHQSPANYFSPQVSPEQFRYWTRKIERAIKRKKYVNRLRNMFSKNKTWRIRRFFSRLFGQNKPSIPG